METETTKPQPSAITRSMKRLGQLYQHFLDIWTPYAISRWFTTVILMLMFVVRVLYLQGWYIITYALGIYHLNLFIAFLTPKIDPAVMDDDDDDGPELPTRSNEEFRPFIRRLPEFKFWYSATKAVVIAISCTFFEFLNIPVFWPILLLYFITLFGYTMKRQIKHMVKYKYLPWSRGKTKYRGKEDTGKVIPSNSPGEVLAFLSLNSPGPDLNHGKDMDGQDMDVLIKNHGGTDL